MRGPASFLATLLLAGGAALAASDRPPEAAPGNPPPPSPEAPSLGGGDEPAGFVSSQGSVPLDGDPEDEAFPHEAHTGLFPTCEGCHAGAVLGEEAAMYPREGSCGECHDGVRADPVEWTPPEESRISNLRFAHRNHRALLALFGESAPCEACHTPEGAPHRMQVEPADPDGCLSCHAHEADSHLAREAQCDVCHVPLTAADRLPVERIAAFPAPESHADPDFVSSHAPETLRDQVSCGMCHARETCEVCHVNADRLDAVMALERDDRVASLTAEWTAEYPLPDTHLDRDWPWDHGSSTLTGAARCANCHTQATCRECHIGEGATPSGTAGPVDGTETARPVDGAETAGTLTGGETAGGVDDEEAAGVSTEAGRAGGTYGSGGPEDSRGAGFLPRWAASGQGLIHGGPEPPDTVPAALPDTGDVIRSLPQAVPGGAPGVDLSGAGERVHPPDFQERHASFAATGTLTCTGCHTEQYCADCHAGPDSRAFHPDNFLERHAADVFAGVGDCQSCHSTEAFCRDCHVEAGVASDGTRSTAFHSAEPNWIVTHGQAARIGLQSCASCHGQTDCLECHSTAGWGVNPHGPGFDADAMAERSPGTCELCHLGGAPR